MAIANLHETWLTYKTRINDLINENTKLATQKQLLTYSQADRQSLLSSEKHSVRDYFKTLFESDEELKAKYSDYTKIPDFEEAIDKITAAFEEELNELAACETAIDTQITTNDTEKAECEAWMESFKQMLSSNIQEDMNLKLGS